MKTIGSSLSEGFSRGFEAFLSGRMPVRERTRPSDVPPGNARPEPGLGLSGKATTSLWALALGAGTVSLARRAAHRRRSTTSRSLARGAVAGASAAGALLLLRQLTARRTERPAPEGTGRATAESMGAQGDPGDVAGELLAGAGRGLIYAALLEPWLPGPPLVRGALVGTADYLAAPIGGLFVRMQALSPIRRIPVISALLDVGGVRDEPFRLFLLEGVLLGLIYGDGLD